MHLHVPVTPTGSQPALLPCSPRLLTPLQALPPPPLPVALDMPTSLRPTLHPTAPVHARFMPVPPVGARAVPVGPRSGPVSAQRKCLQAPPQPLQ